ncbi:MAG: SCO family protein [Pseudomonadota bacterium]
MNICERDNNTLICGDVYPGNTSHLILHAPQGLGHIGRPHPITEQAFRGQPTALFFGFTHCPEVCPTTVYEMNGWFAELGEEAANINAYFVTIDPERDTPDLLSAYLE